MFHPVPEIVFQAKKYIRLLDIKNQHFCSNSTNIWRYWPHSPLPHIVNIKVIKSHSLNLRNGLNLYLKYIIIVQVRYRKLILLWMKMYQISGETKMSSTKYWTIEILILGNKLFTWFPLRFKTRTSLTALKNYNDRRNN